MRAAGRAKASENSFPAGSATGEATQARQIGDLIMTDISTDHGTVVVERTLDVPVSRVYAALADAKERAGWAAPSDTAVFIYDETNFSVGGRDLARCGAKEDPRYRVEARYLDIVGERRVVWTETIHEADKLLATNITTVELMPDGERTRLKMTVQVTSFTGAGMIDNTEAGHKGSLANMARHLEQPEH
jgi:uncharacterized protein YndB with AHSA1/START domain